MEIPAVEGLDSADGLLRVAGNRKLYLKLLRQFSVQQAEAPAQIAEQLEARRSGHGGADRAHRQGRCGEPWREGRAVGGGRAGESPPRGRRSARGWKRCAQQLAAVLTPFVDRLRAALGEEAGGCRRARRHRRRSRAAEARGRADDRSTWPSSTPPRPTASKPIAACSLRSSPPRSSADSSSRCRATPSARRRRSWSKRPGRTTSKEHC